MNILVTGANGQLGNEVRVVSRNSKDIFVFTDIVEVEGQKTTILDVSNLESIRELVKHEKIQIIINCAAYTNVDKAEEDFDNCELLNATAPENLAIAMKEVGGLLIHISTDYVFGKEHYNTPCKEDQIGTPTGVYGITKLHGEEKVLNSGVEYLIFRTAWLYSEYGKNFVKTMLNLTNTRSQLKVVFDQVGTPTYARDLAEVIIKAIEDYKTELLHNKKNKIKYSKKGIYHFSNEGVCSWFDFTKMIAEYAGRKNCDIQPCHSEEFPSPVKRPAYSVLDKTKIKETFGIQIPYWTDSLKKCLKNMIKA